MGKLRHDFVAPICKFYHFSKVVMNPPLGVQRTRMNWF
jgi:predicted RNA methylase